MEVDLLTRRTLMVVLGRADYGEWQCMYSDTWFIYTYKQLCMSVEMKRGLHFHVSFQVETLQFPCTSSDNNATFLNESFACLTLSLCDTIRDLLGQALLIAAGRAIQEV
jgi:hypothetical protein